MNKGHLFLYKNSSKILSYYPNHKGLSSAFIENIPMDLDMDSKTLLIQENLSPSLGNFKTAVKEISLEGGIVIWEYQKSQTCYYSFDKKYIMFYAFYPGNSFNRAVYYFEKQNKKLVSDIHSKISFWL